MQRKKHQNIVFHLTQWPKAVHPAHAGPSPDPDNGAGHPEQRQHEHVAGIPDSCLHHSSSGEEYSVYRCLQASTGEFYSRKPGAGSNGDRTVHPEHTGGESRSCPLYLHQSGRWAIANPGNLVLKGSLVDQIPGKHFPLDRHDHTSPKK